MKNLIHQNWFNSACDALIHPHKNEHSRALTRSLSQLWQRFIDHLTVSGELQVWQKCDRHGETWWYAYDPVSNRKFCCTSEAEMRVWIERRYCRSPRF